MKANLMKSPRLRQVIKRLTFNRAIVLLLLLVIVAIGAVPSYVTGNWSWIELPKFANFSSIKVLQTEGLELPGWETLEQKTVTLGGHKWSYQEIKGDLDKPVLLLLSPPNGPIDQPQVEWVDINSVFQWKTDSSVRLNFTVETKSQQAQVNAHLFRAWTQQQTFGVVQWYAWATGGHPATSQWFWVDQIAQLKRQRVPWVAVSIQIPMEPLGDLADVKPIAESLSKTVQQELMKKALAGGE